MTARHDPSARFTPFEEALTRRSAAKQLRTLKHYAPEPGTPFVHHGDHRLLNFASNDYLGLAGDPEVIARAADAARTHGAGATASRLVAGGYDIHEALEAALGDFTGRPAALLFNSGYQANVSIIPALTNRQGLILCDRRSHNSILQGALLSRAKILRFRHNDPEDLDRLLSQHAGGSGGPILIVTESIFSMDGDRAPLEAICAVAEEHGAILMVDDAHAIGVWGERGEGLAPGHERVDLVLGTFGKAFGAAGAFVACGRTLHSHLVNFCGGLIYSTAPTPATVGAVRAALEKVRSGEPRQDRFRARIAEVHAELRSAGLDPSPSDSQIIPIPMSGEEDALACAEFLRSRGILTLAVRPPTVPPGTSRLRVALTRLHEPEHVSALISGVLAHGS